ncbi:MAG TPA: AAA family ATPase [Gemmatimonadaceae bacterium]|jgi:ATP-dependent Clp protease ATP-binding subunit ClpA
MLDDVLGSDGQTLSRTTRDLTAEARAGRLETVRCRDDEIARVVDILLRQSKNNPALVGPAGVGKTAIAEGLAQRIASGDVPLALRSVKLLALDHVALLAGTMYRGQYEERLRDIVKAASSDPDIILFIDELHNLIGQGTAMGAAMDAANMLKPALVRGEFRVIGATTQDEYDHWVRGDPALERRFQKITVRELSVEQTLEVLHARKERLERHHNVAIAEEALVASVALTDRYVTDRARPDRAIDALDEACAHTQAVAQYPSDLEALIVERRHLVRLAERDVAAAPRSARTPAEETESVDDPIERMARGGIAALERFGAELEAAFTGQRNATPTPAPAAGSPSAEPSPNGQTEPAPVRAPRVVPEARSRLAALETELQRRFIDAGLVVRAHDVARVVAVATGQDVQWTN